MSDPAERLPVRLVYAWVALYTRGLPTDRRDARRAEIASDLWEHGHAGGPDGAGGVDASMLGRVLAGVPADIAWWVEERGLAHDRSVGVASSYGQRLLRCQVVIIPGIAVLAALVTLAGLPSLVAALIAGLMILALIGLTFGLVGSPVGIASRTEAHMETGRSIDRRRTTLLIVLAVSVIVLATTYAYAMSLEHWGDTRAVIFVSLGWLSLVVGVIALILLVADVVRAHRR